MSSNPPKTIPEARARLGAICRHHPGDRQAIADARMDLARLKADKLRTQADAVMLDAVLERKPH